MINSKEILMSASGTDEHGYAVASIGIFHEIWKADGEVLPVKDIAMEKPILNIFRNGDYVQVDMKFPSKNDIDLRILWDMLEEFCQAANSIDDEMDEIPALTLSIIPNKYDGDYYMLGVNPIFHTLQPNDPTGEPNVIRMVFEEDNFLFYAADKEQIDEIKEEIDQERDDFYYEQQQMKQMEMA